MGNPLKKWADAVRKGDKKRDRHFEDMTPMVIGCIERLLLALFGEIAKIEIESYPPRLLKFSISEGGRVVSISIGVALGGFSITLTPPKTALGSWPSVEVGVRGCTQEALEKGLVKAAKRAGLSPRK